MTKSKSYIDEKGEALELDAAFFKHAKRGRPALPNDQRKQQVTILLDPDVLEKLKQDGKGWQTRTNALLRDALGLR